MKLKFMHYPHFMSITVRKTINLSRVFSLGTSFGMLALATINPLQAAGLTQVFPGGSVQLQAPGYECVEENFYAGSPRR